MGLAKGRAQRHRALHVRVMRYSSNPPALGAPSSPAPAAGIAIVTAEARPARGGWPPTHAWMLLVHDWLTADLNEMLPAADLNIITSNSETE